MQSVMDDEWYVRLEAAQRELEHAETSERMGRLLGEDTYRRAVRLRRRHRLAGAAAWAASIVIAYGAALPSRPGWQMVVVAFGLIFVAMVLMVSAPGAADVETAVRGQRDAQRSSGLWDHDV